MLCVAIIVNLRTITARNHSGYDYVYGCPHFIKSSHVIPANYSSKKMAFSHSIRPCLLAVAPKGRCLYL